MSKINRRRILQAGLAAGTLAAGQTIGQAIAQEPPDSSQKLAQAGLGSPNPNNPGYDRPLSALLVRACGLAVAQFLLSRTDQTYDGSINTLAEYDSRFNSYRQVVSFRAAQLSLAEQEAGPAADLANADLANKTAPGKPAGQAQEMAIGVQEVFFGFALTSDTHHIIALRGTQTGFEWLGNISSRQVNFRNREPQYGRVHRGFQISQEQIITQIRRTIPQLNPALPLFITGHSLGGAVAMLTAADLALDNSFPGRQIRVYTYGSPRVGDPTFTETYSRLVGQTYRVVNLADTVPMTPPSAFRGDLFQHTGQEWSYLTQMGDTGINHAIETYQTAIDRAVEVNQTRTYPMSAVNCG